MTTPDTTTPTEAMAGCPPTALTAEELRVLGTLLDRVNTRGIREAQTLLHIVGKLQKMLGEVTP